MNNVLDKFIDDLEKNLAANKANQKLGTVTISIADYDALVSARTVLDILQDAFVALPNFDFEKLAGVILGVETEDDLNPKPEDLAE